ncbi:MAG TPA: lysine--tRNA ligase [Pyrinomonadaceae bacterium]|jgi:lysyl-tRNA synthetase class 2
MTTQFTEDNDQRRARREHLDKLRELVGNVYPNKFERSRATGSEDTITALVSPETLRKLIADESFNESFAALTETVRAGGRPTAEALEPVNAHLNKIEVRLSGRIATPPRVMGKAAFVHLSDGRERLQIYVRKSDVRGIRNDDGSPIEEGWELFNLLDHGDFIGVAGFLFVTKTGELSVHVRDLQFLAKALLPMPDKMHGISDPEIRQRQRYADLIAGSLRVEIEPDAENPNTSRELSSREVFERRAHLIREMRRFLDDHGYIEVETPMLTPLATGAAARPFKTHHNALDIDLYARIAPELYLKRLVVGGFEKVYELNRNFRNEGISTRHNPEFTMLEFYCAYMDVNGMMDFCEEMIRSTAYTVTGHAHARFGKHEIDFSQNFKRLTMKQAIAQNPHPAWSNLDGVSFDESWLDDSIRVRRLVSLTERINSSATSATGTDSASVTDHPVSELWERAKEDAGLISTELEEIDIAKGIEYLFGEVAEANLNQPTFITDFPKPISPLSKASPTDPTIAERFELFIAGMECANGFSELNDPVEQRERFLEQMKQRERGDEEAMVLDEDYIRALSYGMPPAAGIGIGIDRLVMLLTNKRSIRDVILFPHMRPERQREVEEGEQE